MRNTIAIIAALVLLAGAAYWFLEQAPKRQQRGEFVEVASLATAGPATSLTVTPDGNTLVHLDRAGGALYVADITDPLAPSASGMLDLPGAATSVAISPDGSRALATLYFGGNPGVAEHPWLPGGLAIIDITARDNPVLTEIIGIGHHPTDVAVTGSGADLAAVIAFENPPLRTAAAAEDDSVASRDISQPGQVKVVTFNPSRQHNYRVAALDLSTSRLTEAGMQLPADARPLAVALSPDRSTGAVALRDNGGVAVFDPFWLETRRIFSVKGLPADLEFTPGGNYLLSIELAADAASTATLRIWTPDGDFAWQEEAVAEATASDATSAEPTPPANTAGLVATGRFGTRDFAFVQAPGERAMTVYDISLPLAPARVQSLEIAAGVAGVALVPARGLVAVAREDAGEILLLRRSKSP